MKELRIKASDENLNSVIDFVEEELDVINCPMKTKMQLDVTVEEVFVNIAHYAYGTKDGEAVIQMHTSEEPPYIEITFIDSGEPYDPLTKPDPDITLSAEDRPIGGLGIFMVKKSVDDIRYEYKDGHNILTIKKVIRK